MKTVVVRYDDYMADPSTLRSHSSALMYRWKKEQELFSLCMRFSAPLVVAVIPRPKTDGCDAPVYLDDEKVEALQILQACGLAEIAQHGTTHAGLPGGPTEIYGASQEEAASALESGAVLMERAFCERSKILAPPWNLIDKAGALAAREAGFEIVFACTGKQRKKPSSFYNAAGLLGVELPLVNPNAFLSGNVPHGLSCLLIHLSDIEAGMDALREIDNSATDTWVALHKVGRKAQCRNAPSAQ